jgi:ADP-ribose pyrophosphatase YjhB (NUDIX family)
MEGYVPSLGVNVAVIQAGQILLTLREDFEVWCLPGGEVEAGETLAQAAVREAREETGLEVRLERVVGIYSRPSLGRFSGHTVVFAGSPIGGKLHLQSGETIDLRFFSPADLPFDLMSEDLQRIQDAASGVGGSVAWYHNRLWPYEPGFTRKELYALQDRLGLPPAEFYRRYMGVVSPDGDILEVPALVDLRAHFQSAPLIPPEYRQQSVDMGANVALIQENKVLLTLRQDFRVWCLPGGGLEAGESMAQAALREMREETGLEVTLDRLVGLYSEPRCFFRGLHVPVFAAHLDGEINLQPDPAEVVEARFFAQDELPENCLFGHRQRAIDALAGLGGSAAWLQNLPWPFPPELSRQEIYLLRDRSGLGRTEFYRRHFRSVQPGDETLEVQEVRRV